MTVNWKTHMKCKNLERFPKNEFNSKYYEWRKFKEYVQDI